MIHYIGLNFTSTPDGLRAAGTVVNNKAQVLGDGSVPVAGVTQKDDGVLEVRPGEWLRAGSLALRDAFFRIPARVRRMWGISLGGPAGWIALSPNFETMGPLRLCANPRQDLKNWLLASPKKRLHIYAVLSPKDYFRFAVSGALAIDTTQAEQFASLETTATEWRLRSIEESGFLPSWFPPIFDPGVATGRLSEEGIERTGLPGGLWVVAGADTRVGPLISSCDSRSGALIVTSPESGTLEFRTLVAGGQDDPPPSGFETSRSPLPGYRLSRKTVSLDGPDPAEAAIRATGQVLELLRSGAGAAGVEPPKKLVLDYRSGDPPPWASALRGIRDLPVELSLFAGKEDPGIAFLAGLAHGSYKNLEDLHQKLRKS